jgi:AcrR family transcriptional regulator
MEAHTDSIDISDYRHGRVPRAVREEQILTLAEELFAERGYEGASMDELASRAGISKPVVYDIFGSKEALLERCFERAGDELASSIADAARTHLGDIPAILEATALAFLQFIRHHEKAWAVIYALDSGGRTESHVRKIRTRQARLVARMLAPVGPHADPPRTRAVAYMLTGAFEALANWHRENPEVPDEVAVRWLVEFALPGVERLRSG